MSIKSTRRRSHDYGTQTTKGRQRDRSRASGVFGPWYGQTAVDSASLIGTQTTESENHTWPPPKGGFRGDLGGEFLSRKTFAELPKGGRGRTQWRTFTSGATDLREFHEDAFWTPVETVGVKPIWPTYLDSTDVDLRAKGATAISQCKPTNASSNLLVAIGELVTEGLPSLVGSSMWRDRTLRARNAGGEYLNKEFGWDPLISDIRSFADTIRKSDEILRQYERDKGNLVRRRRNLPSVRTESTTLLSASKVPTATLFSTTGPGSFPFTPGVWSVRDVRYVETWFSGAFSYGLPLNSTGLGGISSLASQADRLFGLSLTPDVLWELTPWSWAVDWFSNTGDVLSNLSDVMTQGLVLHYGYIMEHTVHKRIYSLRGVQLNGQPFSTPDVTLVSETKKRLKASPFGFGVSWDGLSPFQLSIAAALGISRS